MASGISETMKQLSLAARSAVQRVLPIFLDKDGTDLICDPDLASDKCPNVSYYLTLTNLALKAASIRSFYVQGCTSHLLFSHVTAEVEQRQQKLLYIFNVLSIKEHFW